MQLISSYSPLEIVTSRWPGASELIKAARRASQLAATERPPVPHFGQSL